MVSVNDNKTWWDEHYDWRELGDEWSRPWGDATTQWYGSILPRIHRFLPAGRILEIGSGFGRWTQFLKDRCDQLTALDLAENCVAACKERFSDATNIAYIVNDGSSLGAIPDSSIDFVFSFDSLVHADSSTLEAYLAQLARILTAEGAAFIHHSNLAAYPASFRRLARTRRVESVLRRVGAIEYLHIRDPSVSAEHVAAYVAPLGLQCIAQEITTWLTRRTWIDCMSTIVPADGPHARENRVLRNSRFRSEAAYLQSLSTLYGQERHRPDGRT
jgi:ubiquinone/menaquinone biosynthesis C-methylase UbiE